MPSGLIMWGLDQSPDWPLFALYGVPYQPAGIAIAPNNVVVDAWVGPLGETELRAAIENLLTASGA